MATSTSIRPEHQAARRRWLPTARARLAASAERREWPEVVSFRETGRTLAATKAVRP